jgi:DNA-binding transcriptional LysR family regulator
VELTLAGEALLERARRLLREVDHAVAAAPSAGGENLGTYDRTVDAGRRPRRR